MSVIEEIDKLLKEASTLAKEKKYEKAMIVYTEAIKLNAYYPQIYNGQADCLRNIGKYGEALECCDKAIELLPNYDSYAAKMVILELLERYEDAIECADKTLEMSKDDTFVLLYKGNFLHKLNRYDEALKVYDESIDSSKRNFYAYTYKGHVYNDLKEYEKALESFEEALNLNPNHFEALEGKSKVLMVLGRTDDDLTNVIKFINK